MKNKVRINTRNWKVILIAVVCVLLLIFLFFKIINYKKVKTGNNISDKTLQEIESCILNISSYDAKIEVIVESNKNENKYIMNQKFVSPNLCTQEVIEPKNIEGLTIKYNGNNMEIINSKLNLTTIYENYKYLSDNVLWLSDFIKNYKNNSGKISEKDGIIIMETKCTKNPYISSEKLYIDRNANKITKLIIEDKNNKSKIYITYKEMKIDSLNPSNILAFKTEITNVSDI